MNDLSFNNDRGLTVVHSCLRLLILGFPNDVFKCNFWIMNGARLRVLQIVDVEDLNGYVLMCIMRDVYTHLENLQITGMCWKYAFPILYPKNVWLLITFFRTWI